MDLLAKVLIVCVLLLTGCTTIRINRPEYHSCRQIIIRQKSDISQRKAEIIQVCRPVSEEQAQKFVEEML